MKPDASAVTGGAHCPCPIDQRAPGILFQKYSPACPIHSHLIRRRSGSAEDAQTQTAGEIENGENSRNDN